MCVFPKAKVKNMINTKEFTQINKVHFFFHTLNTEFVFILIQKNAFTRILFNLFKIIALHITYSKIKLHILF